MLSIALSLFANCEEKLDDTTLGYINEEQKVLLAGMAFFNSYVANPASGTVTDPVTGLMWKICTQGQVLRINAGTGLYDCEGVAGTSTVIGRYGANLLQYCSLNLNDCNTISFPSVLVGQNTGLSGTSEAFDSCDQDTTGGHTDWRVASFPELRGLTLAGSLNSLLIKFPNTVEDYYWSSWAKEGKVDTARAISFTRAHFGEETSVSKTSRYFVRCVRNLP